MYNVTMVHKNVRIIQINLITNHKLSQVYKVQVDTEEIIWNLLVVKY